MGLAIRPLAVVPSNAPDSLCSPIPSIMSSATSSIDDARALGRRLRTHREAAELTQEEVAEALGLARSAVSKIESGAREVTGLELSRLARLYGRSLDALLGLAEADAADDPGTVGPEPSAAPLAVLFRAEPRIARHAAAAQVLRRVVRFGVETAHLLRRLEVDEEQPAIYDLPRPRDKWRAIEQGEEVAADERGRLGLGTGPVIDLADLLESQGVRAAWAEMPEAISGVTFLEPELAVVVNGEHHWNRRRFSWAHEYAHVLMDRHGPVLVSRGDERDELREVRANAFAAAFLLPEEGLRSFLERLGKGRGAPSRRTVWDADGTVEARERRPAAERRVQLHDLVVLADHFGVSREAALYRLANLRLVERPDVERLRQAEEAGHGRQLARTLGLGEWRQRSDPDGYRHRFLGLALEAWRRELISRAKLVELAALVDLDQDAVDRLLAETGLEDDAPLEALLPPFDEDGG